MQRFELTPKATLGPEADYWREPGSLEGMSHRDCWNVTMEADLMVSRSFGVSVTTGVKSAGFFPGRPKDRGAYLGAGALVAF